MAKLCFVNKENPKFLSFSSVMRNLLQANFLGFIETLRICTRWTTTSGTPWWKSKINPSRSLRRLLSWKSPCRPPGKSKSCNKNTSTRRYPTSPIALLPGCGCQRWSRWASAATLSVLKSALSCHHQQTNRLFSEPLTVKTAYGTLRNGGLSRLKQHRFVIFRDNNSTKLSG